MERVIFRSVVHVGQKKNRGAEQTDLNAFSLHLCFLICFVCHLVCEAQPIAVVLEMGSKDFQ